MHRPADSASQKASRFGAPGYRPAMPITATGSQPAADPSTWDNAVDGMATGSEGSGCDAAAASSGAPSAAASAGTVSCSRTAVGCTGRPRCCSSTGMSPAMKMESTPSSPKVMPAAMASRETFRCSSNSLRRKSFVSVEAGSRVPGFDGAGSAAGASARPCSSDVPRAGPATSGGCSASTFTASRYGSSTINACSRRSRPSATGRGLRPEPSAPGVDTTPVPAPSQLAQPTDRTFLRPCRPQHRIASASR